MLELETENLVLKFRQRLELVNSILMPLTLEVLELELSIKLGTGVDKISGKIN